VSEPRAGRGPVRWRRPAAWAGLAGLSLAAALMLPPAAADALFWGGVALAAVGLVGWAWSLPDADA